MLSVHLVIIFVNNELDAQFFFIYVYFYSLDVSDNHMFIIRRINCINMIYGLCYFAYMTVLYEGLLFIQICVPDGHLHTVTYTRFRIDTVNSPDNGHIAVRNM